jgi:hypothetical protein
MDHVYPYHKGGETTVNNLVTACAHCNTSKQGRVGIWPASLDILDQKRAEAVEIKRQAAQVFINMTISAILLGLSIGLPESGLIYKVVAGIWFAASVFYAGWWIVDLMMNEQESE